jgi:PIN like domain
MSKKPLGSSGLHSTTPLDSYTFFTDRGLGAFDVPNALRTFGLRVEIHKDHFNSDCEDSVWISEAGRRGWIILAKDKRFRSRQIEVAALMKSNTGTFVLTNSNTTGPQNAATFIKAIPQIFAFLRRFSRPFLANITPAGDVSLVLTHEMMIDLHGKLPR